MTPRNILIVEDDPDFAAGLAEYLELGGHRVTLAPSGEDALAGFGDGDFDIAILDAMLPGLDGLGTLRAMREIDPGLQAVVMTGFDAGRYCGAARELGAVDVLQKPFEPARLFESIRPEKREDC